MKKRLEKFLKKRRVQGLRENLSQWQLLGSIIKNRNFSQLRKSLPKCSREGSHVCYHISVKPREGNGTPLQYSCLENPMDGGVWWATVRGVAKYQTRLNDFTSQASKLMLKTLQARLQQDMNRELPDV